MARPLKSDIVPVFCILFLVAVTAAATPGHPEFPGTVTNTTDYSITFFVPAENSIHSDQINDMINSYNGSVIFGTGYGLSVYNGSWSTRHINRDNFSAGLLNDYITAVENDKDGNLWIGYSGGIQIYNGIYYRVIRDQQLLKDPRITDLQRWDEDMWIATGNAGIHRFRNGTLWTWYQPDTRNGSPFYTVTSMALDTTGINESLIIATHDEGLWRVRSQDDPVVFERLNPGDSIFDPLRQIRRDPLGGVYLFNESTVMHFASDSGFTDVLSNSDLSYAPIAINDVSGSMDGTLYLATDNGIYLWRDGEIYRRISGFDGIGPSSIVKFIYVDNENRAWYTTHGYVGYFQEHSTRLPLIPVEQVTPATPAPVPVQPETTSNVTSPVTLVSPSIGGIVGAIIDPIVQAVRVLAEKFGIKI